MPRRIAVVLLFLLIINMPTYTAYPIHSSDDYSRIYRYETFYLHVKTGGWIENLGGKPVPVNQTDLLIFDYPLNMSDQKVLGVKAYVDNTTKPYRIEYGNTSNTLVIIDKELENESIKPGERIGAWVEYNVSIDMAKRLEPVTPLIKSYSEGKSIGEIIDQSGNWSSIREGVRDEKYYKNTRLWNQSHPLIKLLIKYINNTVVRRDKPLEYVLSIINWIDMNIVYSTRIPPRQPWEVIVEGVGDCDDKSNLLVTLLRTLHIPSFLEIGILYLSSSFKYENTEVNGYIHYKFIGGGGHGWVVAYIPPWGWLRIDLTASISPGIGRITTASFYVKPIIVTEHVYGRDYASATAQFTQKIEEKKLKYDLLIEIKEYNP